MGRPIVYLAGPIAGMTGPEAMNWRIDAQALLGLRGIDTLNPLRAKGEILTKDEISTNFRDYDQRGPFFTSRGVMARDFYDVKRCGALLVNLLETGHRPSYGTVMELAWAYAMQKPAVVALRGPVGHPMLHEAMPFQYPDLDAAIDAVATVLGR